MVAKLMRPFFLMTILFCMAIFSNAGMSRIAIRGISVGMVLEPPHLDPTAGAAGAIDEIVYANLFEGLTKIDRNGDVQPLLAKSWTISGDGETYTFSLVENVRFHDNTSFDANDVIFSFERAMALDSVNAQKNLFEPIQSMEAKDPYTLIIHLKRPTGDFLYNLGWGDAVIVAKESYENNKISPVGTGPYRFVRWDKGNQVILIQTDSYWGKNPSIDQVTFKFISDPTAAMIAMQSGDIDAFPNFPAPELLSKLQKDPKFKVVIGTTEGETILAINNRRPPLNNKIIRQAICHAIDRQSIIDGAMFGYGTSIGSHFAPHHPAYIDLTKQNQYDPALARKLLSEAGYKPGELALTIKLPPPSYARRGGEIAAAQLQKAGFKINLIPVEWAQWLDEVFRRKDFDLTIISHTEPLDINIYARPDYYFGYDNAAFKDIINLIAQTTSDEKRIPLYQSAQKMLADDSVNCFLFQLAKHGVWNAQLEGMLENSPIQANDMTEVFWSLK